MLFEQALAEMRKDKIVKLDGFYYSIRNETLCKGDEEQYGICPYIEADDLLSDDWEM